MPLSLKLIPALTEVMLGDEIKADLANPFKPTRIKLIGDSITWGMGSSAGSPIEPRSGTLSDVQEILWIPMPTKRGRIYCEHGLQKFMVTAQ